MNKEEKAILEFLLDTYERSKSFSQDTQYSNRILMTFHGQGVNAYKKYNIEDSDTRIYNNNACIKLKKANIIDFEWLRGSENHILHRAWLNRSSIKNAYSYIGRTPKSEYIAQIIELIDKSIKECCKNNWAYDCLLDWKENIKTKRKVGSFLPNDISEIKDYLNIICAVSNLDGAEILERVFSKKVLGDSKKFEKMYKRRLVSLLKNKIGGDLDADNASQSQILGIVGIVKYPEKISFCGNLSLISSDKEIINFSLMVNGAYINAKDVDMFNFRLGKEIEKIITIENLANYYDYISTQKKENELVIFHGGYYSPSKGRFFKKIASTADTDITFLHWGDIDFGGFSILKRLRNEINPQYKAMLMGKEDLTKFKYSTQIFSESYGNKLKNLLHNDALKDCYDCIEYMIENKVKLEQEAMIAM